MPNTDSIRHAETIAPKLADAAGAAILPYFRQPLTIDNKLGNRGYDPVTQADREAELAMRTILDELCPDDGVHGEEFGRKSGSSGLTWILDPVDGTRAFVTGVPQWGTLIGLHDGSRTIYGLVDQPFLCERYSGSKLGAQKEDSSGAATGLQVRSCGDLKSAIMLTTTPDMFDSVELTYFNKLRASVMLSRFGGDCYAYCMLASGYVDLVVEASLQSYDIQPLIPIIEAAGGIVTNWQGDFLAEGGQVIAAADPRVHAEAVRALRDCKPA